MKHGFPPVLHGPARMPGPRKGSPDPPCLPHPPCRINWSLRRRVALCSDLASSALSHYILLSFSRADFPILIYRGLLRANPGVGPTMLHFSDGEIEAWRHLTGGHSTRMALTQWPGSALQFNIPSVFAQSITFIPALSCYALKAKAGSRTLDWPRMGVFLCARTFPAWDSAVCQELGAHKHRLGKLANSRAWKGPCQGHAASPHSPHHSVAKRRHKHSRS